MPAAIYIIGQHLIAGVVRSRLLSRFGDGARQPAPAVASRPAGPRQPSGAMASPGSP